ncbi:hypothetical protein A9Q75_00380 [Colwellia psychrerythraea]|uniref:DUF1800 domain-containing protein n=1 Tax=Colwellia psychrerythraea TaxID=28229 RepID=A0A1Y5ER27_COLPS|nr:hypothetical protein A9Q75_00380 [Colwellia psychrerythraea]
MSRESIAVNRFGYGARGDELAHAKADPKKWLSSQLQTIEFSDNQPSSDDVFVAHAKFQKQKKLMKQQQKQAQGSQAQDKNKMIKSAARKTYMKMSAASLKQAITSKHSVSWRLLDFFSNHFSVSTSGRLMVGLSPTLEREAIAPNLLGNFGEMLLAVEQHPAMLIYLNNEKSFGANSRMSKKRKVGLNENLAREIMELHTLGVNGGYSQTDVIELAKGITGWSVKNTKKEHGTGFVFRTYGHEPGARILLGKKYAQRGIMQGQQMLRDLAMHPSTAKYVCTKIAHHFVSENPAQSLIEKMQKTWLNNQGNIKQVMLTLFDAEEAWLESPQKFKTPREFVISSYRAIAPNRINDRTLFNSLTNLGQMPFNAGSPAGFSDEESDWLGASALMARVEWSSLVSAQVKRINAEQVMATALGSSISQNTYQMVMRAESRQQASTLLLMSPEFQRR